MAKSDIRLITVELAFGDDPFELPDDPDLLRVRGGHVMWQKERLLQLGAEHLADEGYDGFVFVDADTIFDDTGWPVAVAKLLEKHPMGQCFSEVDVRYTDQSFTVQCGVKQYFETGSLEGRVGHAWAVRADRFFDYGLYQHGIVGGGDSLLFLAAIGRTNDTDAWHGKLKPHDFMMQYGPEFMRHYTGWCAKVLQTTDGNVGYADQRILSLSHGVFERREYLMRHQILKQFDPVRDVSYAANGPLEWTQRGRRFAIPMRSYFHNRNEDDQVHAKVG